MIGGLETVIAATVAALIAFGVMIAKAWRAGRDRAARDAMAERLANRQVADAIEEAIAGRDIGTNRREIGKWARR
jgi:hypothetical protein